MDESFHLEEHSMARGKAIVQPWTTTLEFADVVLDKEKSKGKKFCNLRVD